MLPMASRRRHRQSRTGTFPRADRCSEDRRQPGRAGLVKSSKGVIESCYGHRPTEAGRLGINDGLFKSDRRRTLGSDGYKQRGDCPDCKISISHRERSHRPRNAGKADCVRHEKLGQAPAPARCLFRRTAAPTFGKKATPQSQKG
jgi:hypothetical protein